MTYHISAMPLWVILIFILGFIYSIVFITKPVKQPTTRLGIIAFYLIYLTYASLLALYGVLDKNTLPPKAILYAGLPLAIILFGIIGNTPAFKRWLASVSLESLIGIHVFRLLGVFFLLLYGFHLLPATFAFCAGLGDMITAIAAWPVSKMAAKRSKGWKVAVYAWNIFGMMDIVDLLIAAVITARAGDNLREVAVFPFVWFPAFAPATILFLHTAVFRKMKLDTNTRVFDENRAGVATSGNANA